MSVLAQVKFTKDRILSGDMATIYFQAMVVATKMIVSQSRHLTACDHHIQTIQPHGNIFWANKMDHDEQGVNLYIRQCFSI